MLAGRGDLRAAGEAAIEEIEIWHRRLSRFAPDSLVSHINREAFSAPVRLDRDTFELLSDAVDVWRLSDGAFDITVGSSGAAGASGAMPTHRGCRNNSGSLRLHADRWTIEFAVRDVSIDLGGIGKGHALDCAARVLRNAGVTAALLHGGTSSVIAIGSPEGCDGWRVAVGARGAERTVVMSDLALSISDPWGPGPGRRATPHIVDPQQRAVPLPPIRATVVGPSARLADAWSTALVVLGGVPAAFPPLFSASIDVHQPALS